MNPKTQKRTNAAARRGFTLIELLIVIAILLALGGLTLQNLLSRKKQADADLQRAQFDIIDSAMKQFQLDMSRWPSDDEGLSVLWKKEDLEDEDEAVNWRGPYLETPVVKDQWGSEIIYQAESETREGFYELLSWGRDREEDTEDDITNLDRFKNDEGELDEAFDDFAEPEPEGGS